MRVLFDIVHPAHVHFFRYLRADLESDGHRTLVVARDKDVTLPLLASFGIPHEVVGRAGHATRLGQAAELVHRDWTLWRLGRRFRPDVVLTRNPAGVQAARLLGVPGIFDTDDGRAAGIHFRAAAPFATVITTPTSMPEDYGEKHRRYPGYKALAYLHPRRFTPDVAGVRADLGLADGERLFVLRLVANDAVHDTHSVGLSGAVRRELVLRLAAAGRVLISAEGTLEPELDRFRFDLQPHRLHDVLAAADLYAGDSGTMAAEGALLGTPSLRLSSWSGPSTYLDELEHAYGLVWSFAPDQGTELLARVDTLLADLDASAAVAAAGRQRMLDDKVDVTSWYRELVDDVVAG